MNVKIVAYWNAEIVTNLILIMYLKHNLSTVNTNNKEQQLLITKDKQNLQAKTFVLFWGISVNKSAIFSHATFQFFYLFVHWEANNS